MAGHLVTDSDFLIHEDTKEYPITLAQFATREMIALGIATTRDYIKSKGYCVVDVVTPPKGDVVTEIFPVRSGDGWIRAYEVRDFNSTELENRLDAAKYQAENTRKLALSEILDRGVAYDFGEGYGVQHIQLRTLDRTNLVGMVVMGTRYPDQAQTFCTYENKVIPLTGTQVLAMADAAFASYTKVMSASWALREMILEATDIDSIPSKGMIDAELTQVADAL